MSILTKVFSGGAGDLIKSVGDVVGKFVTTDKDRDAMKMQLLTLIDKDKQSARDMYSKDNSLQKTYALVFLVGYIVVSMTFIYFIFVSPTELNTTQSTFLTMIFTAMSMKVNTITDFLFGGSLSKTKSSIGEKKQRKKDKNDYSKEE